MGPYKIQVFCVFFAETSRMAAAVDLLEKRLEALELQVLGKKGSRGKAQDITELLIHTKMMIASALSLREVITSILEKMPKLNEYLDPSYSVNDLETEVKRQYVMLLYPELKETAELINKFEFLKPVVDSKCILEISQSMEKLKELTAANISLYEESTKTTNDVLKALQAYNNITVSIRKLFAELEKSVAELESSLQPKVKMEE